MSLSTENKYDVLVVGAGIFGMSSALRIKESSPEKRVLVIDRFGDAGQGNSGRSNAMYRNMFTSADNRILADTSIDYYNHVQSEIGTDVGMDPIGYLWLMSEKQLSVAEHQAERMRRTGVQVRSYPASELSSMIPGMIASPASTEEGRLMRVEDVSAGLFGPKCGRLAPEKLVAFYKDRFLALGGAVLFDADAVRLIVDPKDRIGLEGEPFLWQESRVSGVKLEGGREIRATTTIIAGGAWNNELLDPAGVDGHAKSKVRQLFTVSTHGNDRSLDRLMWTKGFNPSGTLPFVILPKAGINIKPVKESYEFWLGGEDEVNRPFMTLPEHDIDRHYPAEQAYYDMNIYPILRSYFPQFEGVRTSRMWSGLYSYNTIDNLPYVFTGEGLVVVGGDSGSGVMKGDAMGRIAEAVYRGGEGAEAVLYGGTVYRSSKLSFARRDVEREDWVI